MNARLITSLLIFGVAAAVFVVLGAYLPLGELSIGVNSRSWFPAVNIHHNAYHMWRIDPVAGAVSKTLSAWSAHTFIPLSMMILCVGTYRIIRSISLSHPGHEGHFVMSWLFSITAPCILLASIGADAVTLGSLGWLPLLSLTLSALATVSRAGLVVGAAPLWLMTLGISVIMSQAANQLAPFTAFVSVIIALVILQPQEREPLPRSALCLMLALAFSPALYAALTAPAAPFPNYPHLAHIAPDDGLVGIVRPLVGFDYPLQVVDRGAVQRLYALPSISLAILVAIAFFSAGAQSSRASRLLITCAGVVVGIALLDTLLPERFAVISPLMSISRLLPWGTSFSLTPCALALSAWLVCVGVGASPQSWARALGYIVVSTSVLCASQSTWWRPTLSARAAEEILSDKPLRAVALSPSLAVLEAFERSAPGVVMRLEKFRALASRTMQSLRNTDAILETSPVGNGRTLERLVDGSAHTRWTSNRNQQLGDELLTLRFAEPMRIRGIELDPGEYNTDFPRGISVRGGECREETARQIAQFPSWQGALSFTSDGFPYFGAQSDVKILFAQEEEVECLFIRQTGTAPFSWSVAELRLMN